MDKDESCLMIREWMEDISDKLIFKVRYFISALIHFSLKRYSEIVPDSCIKRKMSDILTYQFCDVKVICFKLINLV